MRRSPRDSGASSLYGGDGALVAVGLGSNQGDRSAHLDFARQSLAPLLSGMRCSRVYQSEPLQVAAQPDFLNACCAGRTKLPPAVLLDALQALEQARGRVRELRYGPRTLDLDILLYGDQVIDEPDLTIPHPRMHERAFVLIPLREVLPEWRHPLLGRSIIELAASIPDDGVQPFAPPSPACP